MSSIYLYYFPVTLPFPLPFPLFPPLKGRCIQQQGLGRNSQKSVPQSITKQTLLSQLLTESTFEDVCRDPPSKVFSRLHS